MQTRPRNTSGNNPWLLSLGARTPFTASSRPRPPTLQIYPSVQLTLYSGTCWHLLADVPRCAAPESSFSILPAAAVLGRGPPIDNHVSGHAPIRENGVSTVGVARARRGNGLVAVRPRAVRRRLLRPQPAWRPGRAAHQDARRVSSLPSSLPSPPHSHGPADRPGTSR